MKATVFWSISFFLSFYFAFWRRDDLPFCLFLNVGEYEYNKAGGRVCELNLNLQQRKNIHGVFPLPVAQQYWFVLVSAANQTEKIISISNRWRGKMKSNKRKKKSIFQVNLTSAVSGVADLSWSLWHRLLVGSPSSLAPAHSSNGGRAGPGFAGPAGSTPGSSRKLTQPAGAADISSRVACERGRGRWTRRREHRCGRVYVSRRAFIFHLLSKAISDPPWLWFHVHCPL
jgi:hypothetical protein